MLVLSRKPGERFSIGNDIWVTIVRIGPNSVRVGIDAPGHLNIVREELTLEIAPHERRAVPVCYQAGNIGAAHEEMHVPDLD